MIIHNATIHSPVERFATAIHVDGEVIVWMGDEDTAAYRIKAHPEAEVFDAEGLLLTPSFHNAFLTPADVADYHAQGVTAGHVLDPVTQDLGAFDLTSIRSIDTEDAAIVRLASGATAAEQAEFLATQDSAAPALTLETEDDVTEFLTLGSSLPPAMARVYVDSTLDVPVDALAGWQVVIIVHDSVNFSVAALAQAGIPYAIGGEGSPWDLITKVLFSTSGPVSARAAFNALTRGTWRLTPGQYQPRGVLSVGSFADLALWRVDTLAVQAPDTDASMWSTDQRAGTPLLPALGNGENAPELVALYRRGVAVR